MPGYQSFSLNAVEKAQSSAAAAYREFLRRPGFSMGMYLLPAGSQDAQHPHSADEVYTVQHGRAQLKSKVRGSTSGQATSSRWTAAGTTTSLTSPRIWPSWSYSLRPTTRKAKAGVVKVIETADAPRHTGPVPQAVESAGWIFVSALFGNDPQTGRRPAEAGEEADQIFANLTAILAAGAPACPMSCGSASSCGICSGTAGLQPSVGPPFRRPPARPLRGRGEGFRPGRRERPLHGGGPGIPRLTVCRKRSAAVLSRTVLSRTGRTLPGSAGSQAGPRQRTPGPYVWPRSYPAPSWQDSGTFEPYK